MFRPPKGTPDGWGFEESPSAATCISTPRHSLARKDISSPGHLLRTHCHMPDVSSAVLSSRIHVPIGEVATSSSL